MMTLEKWSVEPISFQSARPFIQTWHKMPNVNGLHVTQCFGLFRPAKHMTAWFPPVMCGVAMYGKPAMSSQGKKWSPENPDKLIELRRLAFRECTGFAKTFFVNKTLEWFSKNADVQSVVAYADTEEGDVYRALNWTMVGVTAPGRILMVDGQPYHDRTLRMDKPYAHKIKERLRLQDPNVKLVDTSPKHIFLRRLNKVVNGTKKSEPQETVT